MSEIRVGVIYRNGLEPDDYQEAIEALHEAKVNLGNESRGCSICTDSGHESSQCHHNPLVMARRAVATQRSWRCFHCNEVFTDPLKAKEHFGDGEIRGDKFEWDAPKCKRTTLPAVTG